MLQSANNKVVIIGGGFYGLSVALYIYDELGIRDITIIEKEIETMNRASYVNQARVHNGYHYPRSVLTGYRSAVNFPRFVEQYDAAIVSNFDKYYAVARHLSKVNARQFQRFAEKIGSQITAAPTEIKRLFNPTLTEEVFKVKECAFDARLLRQELLHRITERKTITIATGESVEHISSNNNKIEVSTDKTKYKADIVLNCAYSNINRLHRLSGLPLVAMKHEITEMCLVRMPSKMKDFSITMMDGPFFSLMPFPSKKLHTLSHVRYTPHESWIDDENTPKEKIDTHAYLRQRDFHSNYRQMYNDVIRYIPSLKEMEYVESIVEVKTVLVKSEDDDSRPILFNTDFGIPNYICIMGGKLDNIYDVFEELEGMYGKEHST